MTVQPEPVGSREQARVLARHQLANVLPHGVVCTCGTELAALNSFLDDASVKGEPLALATHQLQELEEVQPEPAEACGASGAVESGSRSGPALECGIHSGRVGNRPVVPSARVGDETARASIAAAYIACVVLANVLTEHLGLVSIGFGLLVTAGTFAAGGTLLARNVSQDVIGRRAVLGLMLVGCALSWWLASPQLAVASAVGFGLSESADMAVFTPLRSHGWSRAVVAASLVSAVVDTFAFLWLAGFPVTADTVSGQLLVKVGISWAVALTVTLKGGRLLVYRTADRPPLAMRNRYGSQTIGIVLRVGLRRVLSIRWARPS